MSVAGEKERGTHFLFSVFYSLTCVFPSTLIDFFYKKMCATWHTLIGTMLYNIKRSMVHKWNPVKHIAEGGDAKGQLIP